MVRSTFLVVVAAASTWGCATVDPVNTLVHYEEETPSLLAPVPEGGAYSLYRTTEYTPRVTVYLKEGEQVGFRKGTDGKTRAVAGHRLLTLEDGRDYYWRRDFWFPLE